MGFFGSTISSAASSSDPSDSPYVSPRSYMPPPPLRRQRPWRHIILFLLTVATTTLVGAEHFASFYVDFGSRDADLSASQFMLNGLWYSASILAILGAHEFGHYFACVAALLPAGATAAHRHARRVHPDPPGHPREA
jgi:hypothetical protein